MHILALPIVAIHIIPISNVKYNIYNLRRNRPQKKKLSLASQKLEKLINAEIEIYTNSYFTVSVVKFNFAIWNNNRRQYEIQFHIIGIIESMQKHRRVVESIKVIRIVSAGLWIRF